MSDFDKEAEREKLREKYEQEQEEREATEKMSELLLQGATMTNAHCSQCGDPIFRYDGQEFCASCERAVDRDTGESEDAEADETDTESEETLDQEGRIEVTSPDDSARVKFGGDGQADAGADQQTDGQSQRQQPADGTDQQSTQGTAQSQQGQPQSPQQGQPQSPQQGQSQTPSQQDQPQSPQQGPSQNLPSRSTDQTRQVPGVEPTEGAADVTVARESLVRTLTRFSQQAEATEDPQRAREYLAAAREAAEALSVLRN